MRVGFLSDRRHAEGTVLERGTLSLDRSQSHDPRTGLLEAIRSMGPALVTSPSEADTVALNHSEMRRPSAALPILADRWLAYLRPNRQFRAEHFARMLVLASPASEALKPAVCCTLAWPWP